MKRQGFFPLRTAVMAGLVLAMAAGGGCTIHLHMWGTYEMARNDTQRDARDRVRDLIGRINDVDDESFRNEDRQANDSGGADDDD